HYYSRKQGNLLQWLDGGEPLAISTLPAGVHIPLPVQGGKLRVVFDVVYDGWPTPLAQAAKAARVQVIGGFELLLAQAARQFQLFTGEPAPVKAMWQALVQAVPALGDVRR
ncbi:MAG: hypothetical protein LBQ92_03175, partial [Propionibacteriaceae bacterium]|nr:hypothetical protein [Propionibacteriaceae bacterium]